MRLRGDDRVEAGVTFDILIRTVSRTRDLSTSASYILKQNVVQELEREMDLSSQERDFLTAFLAMLDRRESVRPVG